MKKTVFAACLVFCLLSTGCGSITNNEAETSSASTTKATTEAVSETNTETEPNTETTTEATAQNSTETMEETTAADVPESETQSNADQSAPTTEQAQELIRALNMMERLVGAGLQYDADTVNTVNGTDYYKVTDSDFSNIAEIRCYEDKYLTQDIISERYSALVDGDSPIFIDSDDKLYMKNSAKGFYIFSDAEPNIEKTSEDGYSILADYDNFGAKETADIRIINVNGNWKICGISFGL